MNRLVPFSVPLTDRLAMQAFVPERKKTPRDKRSHSKSRKKKKKGGGPVTQWITHLTTAQKAKKKGGGHEIVPWFCLPQGEDR